MKKLIRALAIALAISALLLSLVSCTAPAKNPEDAKKALEENSYIIVTYIDNPSELRTILGKDMGLVTYLCAADENYENIIYVYYFETSADAKDAYKEVGKIMERTAAEEGWIIKRSGKMIYTGTEAAVKAAKE